MNSQEEDPSSRRRGPGAAPSPHRRKAGQDRLEGWKDDHNVSHRRVRARIERAFARMKNWKILRDCRRRGDGVFWAAGGIARMHNRGLDQ
ncbi:transposase [Streptomyces viridochromogenes]|uniref:transposase n=1 Tax=Streptomyces viridochromogenes TaxID=1938 RepID=UPI0030B8D83C